ncbi:MAG: hypothetical protein QNJ18_01365 [Xenococcaceae cyanobacterium MO_167.B52]|nr:hypothetical protein [Xenococcaceae cyanobacterium MO_167.B52]
MNKFILFLATSLLSWLTITPKVARTQPIAELQFRDNFCFLEVPELTNKLLRDLPNYANRVVQRTQTRHRNAGIKTYIIDAGKPEFEPLPLPKIEYSSNSSDSVNQIFFTILERQYFNNRKLERESYYWLFLIPTTQGWKMMMLFSRFGDNLPNNPPTPPQESSNGIIGQAINLWLNDCRAGTIR